MVVQINEGHHILKLKYGEVDDWCLTPADVERHYDAKGREDPQGYRFLGGKRAIDHLVEMLDERHGDEGTDYDSRHYRAIEKALLDMVEEVYGLRIAEYRGGRS